MGLLFGEPDIHLIWKESLVDFLLTGLIDLRRKRGRHAARSDLVDCKRL